MTTTLQRVRDSFVADSWRPRALYRYGMLAIIAALMAFQVWWLLRLPHSYPYDRYTGFVVVITLLLNHLAYAFPWSRRVTFILRVTAWLWIAFGLVYLLSLPHVAAAR